MIKIKRVYEDPKKVDGFRILVDRIWPRGVSKEKAKINLWLKEIAPSRELVIWFHEKEGRWNSFMKKYTKELTDNPEIVHTLKKIIKKHKTATLLYSARDTEHNQAIILQRYLLE